MAPKDPSRPRSTESSGDPRGTGARRGGEAPEETTLYFFPDAEVTERELREILESGGEEERCWAISHLVRFAQWEDIWLYVDRDDVAERLGELEMPENLRAAWARILKVETPVG